MKRNSITLLAAAALVGLMTVPASALSVRITENGGTPITCSGVGTVICTSVPNANFAFDIQVGTSNAPGPAAITISGSVGNLTAGDTLKVETSDTNFLIPTGGATLIQTLNTNTPAAISAPGTITGTGYESNVNDLFCQAVGDCTAATPPITFNSFVVGNASVSSVGNVVTAPFSLDEVLNYTFSGSGTALVTATLSEVVPEPASLVLFATALLGAGLLFRRKQQSKRT